MNTDSEEVECKLEQKPVNEVTMKVKNRKPTNTELRKRRKLELRKKAQSKSRMKVRMPGVDNTELRKRRKLELRKKAKSKSRMKVRMSGVDTTAFCNSLPSTSAGSALAASQKKPRKTKKGKHNESQEPEKRVLCPEDAENIKRNLPLVAVSKDCTIFLVYLLPSHDEHDEAWENEALYCAKEFQHMTEESKERSKELIRTHESYLKIEKFDFETANVVNTIFEQSKALKMNLTDLNGEESLLTDEAKMLECAHIIGHNLRPPVSFQKLMKVKRALISVVFLRLAPEMVLKWPSIFYHSQLLAHYEPNIPKNLRRQEKEAIEEKVEEIRHWNGFLLTKFRGMLSPHAQDTPDTQFAQYVLDKVRDYRRQIYKKISEKPENIEGHNQSNGQSSHACTECDVLTDLMSVQRH